MTDKAIQYPSWWPENPYPEDIFPMRIEDYVRMVPDPKERTALTGCLGRLFWNMASEAIYRAFREQEMSEQLSTLSGHTIHFAKAWRQDTLWSESTLSFHRRSLLH